MKKLFTLLVVFEFVMATIAQVPQKMSYQAVIRNTTGGLVTNHAVGMRISILQGSATGTAVYVETQTPTTNANGLATIEIGGGTVITGTFAGINWAAGPYYFKTETDPAGGSSFIIIGTSQLLSVPYSLYSKTSESIADNSVTSAKIVDGTIVAADLAENSVTSARVTDETIGAVDLAANSVTSDKINAGAVTGVKIAQGSATIGQVLKWDGTSWNAGNDLNGNLSLPFTGTVNTSGAAISVTNSNTGELSSGVYGNGLLNGVKGNATAISGETYGVRGETASDSGTGVYAIAHSTSGTTFGVRGIAMANNGTGVFGWSGKYGVYGIGEYGVVGFTALATGSAVRGMADATSGINYGVYGEVKSPSGFAGYFKGGKFYSEGNTGIGTENPGAKLEVAGQVKITGGSPGAGKILTSDGSGLASWVAPVYVLNLPFSGSTNSATDAFSVVNNTLLSGSAITGTSTANTYQTFGVKGISASSQGNGVSGIATSSSGYTNGVYGVSSSTTGTGVFGYADAASGVTMGVRGVTRSTSGFGVHAVAEALSGETYGVYGYSSSTSGTGVIGKATNISGTNYGIKGDVLSSSGYSGYFTGGRFYISGKTGIGIADPAYKLDVIGDRIRLLESGTNDWIALRTDGGTNDYLDLSWGGGSLVMQGATTDENIILNPSMNKVGIKTWTPQYDLDVNGNIRATGSVYYGGTTTTGGTAYTKPDFVFGENYNTLTTVEVEDFLKKENHLPWITSADNETRENGSAVDMTRMAFETVESVENIQLQVIEQQKLIQNQQKEIDVLKDLVNTLMSNLTAQGDN